MLSCSRAARTNAYSVRLMSRWNHVPEGPKDPILGVSEAFRADSDSRKLNLGVGAYRDDNGKPVVLPSVLEASKMIVDQKMNNEYSPIEGDSEFVKLAVKLAFGESVPTLAAVQSLSGTGALRIIGTFIARYRLDTPTVLVPNPTWGNHHNIFNDSGLPTKTYRYYHPETKGLDFEGMMEDLRNAPSESPVILHAAAHNPTGVDPTHEQWKEISSVCKEKNHFVIFDSAYQGFASGDPDTDAFSVRQFVKDGHDIALAQSFAKNFGLYGHRVGVASLIVADKKQQSAVTSQFKIIARPMYSNPPIQGSRIVKLILSDPALKLQWMGEVDGMASRIISMRTKLRTELEALGSTVSWEHITNQIGMFCFSGLTPEQVQVLRRDHHIYMTSNGRISMAGVTSDSISYLAKAIHEVTK